MNLVTSKEYTCHKPSNSWKDLYIITLKNINIYSYYTHIKKI